MRFTDYKTFKTALGGRLLQIEIGKLAEQANGAVTVRYGETVVNVTACMAKQPRENQDFFPLTCEYEEKMYAAGKIPGGFIKREGRPSEKATLSARLMDRPLRPLFPSGFFNDVQVVAAILCVDPDCSPEVAAMIGSSIALSISDIPFAGPTGSVIMGLIEGKPVVNPTLAQRQVSELSLTISGTREAIMMVEAGANEVEEDLVLEVLFAGHEEIQKIVDFIDGIVSEIGKEKYEPPVNPVPEELYREISEFAVPKLDEALHIFERADQQARIKETEKAVQELLAERYPESAKQIASVCEELLDARFRKMILEEGVRPDGRKTTEIRQIWCETGFLPRTHGSGLFKRGQTQALSVTTLAPLRESQTIDGIGDETGKRYMHHYNFPPYSVGETKPMRSPGRREIGHGALAERALIPVLPTEEEFPYAIRVVSEVLSSNGSSSQASVCGSSLSLMDAGVPIKSAVSGVAMGLIQGEDGKVAILTDIQGLEDHYGDMDFKVAGTPKGITALQMDIKVHGLSREILQQAIMQAHEGRAYILSQMQEEISAPRESLSPYAPRIESIQIDPEDIGTIVGKGGKTINGIIAETGVKIDIDDTGLISIAAVEPDGMERAIQMIEMLLKVPELGEVYDGTVTGIKEFGAFVEILPGKEGLLHISEMENHRVNRVEDVMNIGDKVQVTVKGIDERSGKISLSRKALL
ncbi:MAG: polyribonucleotide nucleotidyltransferase [Clostridiales Family XIII bacterium]|jgi:polyribonucleotide nucleotidyltransferase|nr:polyribonucleotide nucleotidyltransferase [Clostridiales Family XIII bacterium]